MHKSQCQIVDLRTKIIQHFGSAPRFAVGKVTYSNLVFVFFLTDNHNKITDNPCASGQTGAGSAYSQWHLFVSNLFRYFRVNIMYADLILDLDHYLSPFILIISLGTSNGSSHGRRTLLGLVIVPVFFFNLVLLPINGPSISMRY